MHVNDTMHWRSHGRLYERMEHVVDFKVDDILDEYKHIHKEHIQRLLKNTHILFQKHYSFLQHVAARKLQSHIKHHILLSYAINKLQKHYTMLRQTH